MISSNQMAVCIILLCAASAVTQSAVAGEATGTIGLTRYHSSIHYIDTVRKITVFKLSPVMPEECAWFALGPTDVIANAALLTAKIRQSIARVVYRPGPSSWGDAYSCPVDLIDYQ